MKLCFCSFCRTAGTGSKVLPACLLNRFALTVGSYRQSEKSCSKWASAIDWSFRHTGNGHITICQVSKAGIKSTDLPFKKLDYMQCLGSSSAGLIYKGSSYGREQDNNILGRLHRKIGCLSNCPRAPIHTSEHWSPIFSKTFVYELLFDIFPINQNSWKKVPINTNIWREGIF